LAYALETITGKPFATSLDDGIIKPLEMTHTSLEEPSTGTECGVIPFNETFSSWNVSIGDGDP
jgi:CubicO group peptidase (beta-lactamase class C family)